MAEMRKLRRSAETVDERQLWAVSDLPLHQTLRTAPLPWAVYPDLLCALYQSLLREIRTLCPHGAALKPSAVARSRVSQSIDERGVTCWKQDANLEPLHVARSRG
jgi:hypothetical protein